jgi:hypothetical protein
MPRIRTIKPELPADVKLASVSRDARLTFIYAITQSDDLGFIAGSPRQLMGALYPLDDDVRRQLRLVGHRRTPASLTPSPTSKHSAGGLVKGDL